MSNHSAINYHDRVTHPMTVFNFKINRFVDKEYHENYRSYKLRICKFVKTKEIQNQPKNCQNNQSKNSFQGSPIWHHDYEMKNYELKLENFKILEEDYFVRIEVFEMDREGK